VTNRQAEAARFLLGWSRERLALESHVPVSSVYILMRLGSAGPEHEAQIRAALEAAGIEFTDGIVSGVQLRRYEAPKPSVLPF
jgi:hypothetical protein